MPSTPPPVPVTAVPAFPGASSFLAGARLPMSYRGWFARLFSLRPRRLAVARLALQPCGEGLYLAASPTRAQLEALARQGLRSVLNLNTEGEPGEPLSPNVEASWAHALDLRHERVSFTVEALRSEDVERFLVTLAALPAPVLVHSLGGRRAAAMGLVHLGRTRGLGGAATVRAARELGLACSLDPLREFVEVELDRRLAQA